MAVLTANGAVTLYYDNAAKLATKSDGVDITGELQADSLDIDGLADIQVSHSSTDVTAADSNTTLRIGNSAAGNGVYNAIKFAGNQQDMYIMSFNNSTQASRRLGFFLGSVAGDAAADERLSILGNGNVGIGTSSPASPTGFGTGGILHLKGSTGNDASIVLEGLSGSGGRQEIGVSGGALQFYRGAATGSMTSSMSIDSSGNIFMGSFNASGGSVGVKFDIGGGTSETEIQTSVNGTATRTHYAFRNDNGEVGKITTNGTATAYNTSSDYRLKTAVEYDWDATSRLKQLKPARFEWVADGDDAVPVDGFLAHEAQDVVPEAITGTKDAMRDEEYTVSAATGDIYTPAVEATYDDDGVELTAAIDEVIHSTDVKRPKELAEGQQWRETTAAVMGTRSVPDYQGIDQSKLTPLLTKALIEAVEKIEQLEARIAALEAN